MKKRLIYFVCILILSAPFTIAQTTDEAKVSIAILGGINFQNLNGKDSDGDKLENELIIGYHAGINIQIPIVPEFFFQPGLLFTAKGAKNTQGTATVKTSISYIEFPLNLVYKPLLGEGHLLLGFGPYVAFGIMGKIKGDNDEIDIKFKNKVKDSDPVDVAYSRALDAGANIFVGYELANGIFCQFNTQLGLLKINPEYENSTDDKASVKNTGFGLSIGYRF